MNEVQVRIARLKEKGWTGAAIADELGVTNDGLYKWESGARYPRLDKAIIEALVRLDKVKRIPKKKRYKSGSRTPQ